LIHLFNKLVLPVEAEPIIMILNLLLSSIINSSSCVGLYNKSNITLLVDRSSISAKISLFLHIGQTNLLSELIFDLVRHDLQKVCPQCNIFGILSLVLYLSKHISQRTHWRQT
jgi:hypothetical protein